MPGSLQHLIMLEIMRPRNPKKERKKRSPKKNARRRRKKRRKRLVCFSKINIAVVYC